MTGNQITISTLTVSSINNGAPGVAEYSTLNVSSLNATSTITASTLSVSTMTGSTLTISRLTGLIISASSITSSDLVLSTLTVSSINGLAPGTGSGGSGGTTIFSTLGVSSLNARSTITTSTLTTTSNVGIGTATPQAPLHVYKAGGGIGNNTLQGEIRVCSDDNQISRIGCYEEPNGTTWGGFFQYNGGGTDLIQIGGKSSGVDQYYMAIQRISGNIGIGTTNPSHTLQVAGAINCSSFLVNGTAVATGTGSVWGVSGSSAYYTSGNVGIGTVSPSNSLTIYAGGSAQYIRSNSSVITGCYSEWRDFSATGRFIIGCDGAGLANFELGAGIIGTWSVNSVIFLTNAAERMRITSDGVVGIGVTNPASGYTTAIPNARLTIRGGTAGQNNGAARLSIGGDNAHYAAIEGAHTSGGASTLAFMTCLNAGTNSANPETRMFINSNGNVGIGTVNPSHLLQVAGAINCTSFLVNGTAVATGTGSVWGVSGSVAYYTSGFVGISTTAPNTNLHVRVPTYANPVFIVDAGGQGTDTTPPRGIGKPLIGVGAYSWSNISSGDYYGIGFGYNANNNAASYYPGEIGFLIQNTGGGEFGDLVFSTRPTTTNTTIASERMRITSGGLIGIGTTNPNAILDIYGSFRILSKPYVALTSGTGIEFVYDGGGNLTCGTRSSSAPTLTTTNMNYAAASHAFYIGSQAGTNALVISSTGNVGIGTATPGNKLHIYSTTANDGLVFQNAFNSSTGSIGLFTSTAAGNHILDGTADAGMILPTATKDLFLNRTTSLYTSMVVKGGTGYVGIGTAAPTQPLDLATGPIQLRNGNINNSFSKYQLIFGYDGSTNYSHAIVTRHHSGTPNHQNAIDFFTWSNSQAASAIGNNAAMSVTSGGVGIGTTAPGYGLDVNGTARITGSLSFSSTGTQTLSNGTCGTIGGFVPFIHCSSDLLIGWSTAPSGNSYNDVNNNAYMGISLRGSGNASSVMCATNYIPFVATKYGNSGGNMMIFGYSAAVGTISSTIGTITHTTSSVSYNTTSDARLKENIEDVSNIRDMIDHLRPRTFTFISDDDKDLQVGFIAQEVREYYPHYVSGTETEKDFLGMDYGKMSPFAIAACKDLYLKNDVLTAQVIAQTTTINALEAQVATLLAWARAQGFTG